jgi:DNA repair exonuclease SbcCD ATPase subunit
MEHCTQHTETRELLQEVMSSTKSAHHRIDGIEQHVKEIEKTNSLLHEMNKNIAVLASSHEAQGKKIDCIEADIRTMKEKPEKRLEGIVAAIITALIGGVIGYLISQL